MIANLYASARQKFIYAAMVLLAVFISFPLVWLLLSAFKSRIEIWQFPPTFWPHKPTISGWHEIFTCLPFGRYFINSVFIAFCTSAIAVFTSSLAGYVFAKFNFRGKNILFILILSGMMVPGVVIVVPNFMIVLWLGWLDTYQGLIIPQGISVFGIFLMRQFIHSIPDDYIDAARIDGLSEFGVYMRIILPLLKPALAALTIFTFKFSWDNLMWPLVVAKSQVLWTLPVGIAGLTGVHGEPQMHLLMPAAALSVIPIIIVFFIFQKQFIEGLTMSGLKG